MSISETYFVHMDPKHHGAILNTAMNSVGVGVAELARRMKMSRTTLYKKFDQEILDFYELLRFGKALNYDFARDIPEISMYKDHLQTIADGEEEYSSKGKIELEECRKSLGHYKDEAYKLAKELNIWKDKYIQVVEELNALRNKK